MWKQILEQTDKINRFAGPPGRERLWIATARAYWRSSIELESGAPDREDWHHSGLPTTQGDLARIAFGREPLNPPHRDGWINPRDGRALEASPVRLKLGLAH